MRDSVPNSNPDTQRRRSTRILQAVPLTVIGVDALGRPFQERTSTLIINCHGCRYQSKHYVLKNMWVTLEVPHPEAAHEPRSVRARVMWIQRPRTVRELFQVGVELEVPGNFWGIGFPPHDWFPFPESTLGEIPVPGAPATSETENTPEPEAVSPAPVEEAAEDNVRTMPVAGTLEPSLALARQMTRLVNEARLQLQTAVRESAAQAVTLETKPLLASLQAQIKDAAEKSIEAVARPAAEQAIRGAQEEQFDKLRHEWDSNLRHSVEHAVERLAGRLVELENSRRADFEQQLQEQIGRSISDLQRMAGDLTSRFAEPIADLDRLRKEAQQSQGDIVREAAQRFEEQAAEARAKLAELEASARQVLEQASSASAEARSNWKTQIEADLGEAVGRWNEHIENSLRTASEQVTERLVANANATSERLERDISSRIAEMNRAFVEGVAEAERKFGSLRDSLSGVQKQVEENLAQTRSAAQHVKEEEARLDSTIHTAAQELENRAASLLEVHSQEISRRAEAALQAWTERLQPALEANGQQIVARIGAELEQALNSRIENAGQLLGRLDARMEGIEESTRNYQDQLNRVSDQAIQGALDRLQNAISGLEKEIGEAGQAAAAKWLAEIESKATETTHTTFESLFKTADWYEKKVQNQMQNTLEKGLDHAGTALREKAGEISRLFATELDHYSRNYVEHTQGQLEEAAKEHRERIQKQSEELAAQSANGIAQQAKSSTEAALRDFYKRATDATQQVQSAMDAQTERMRSQIEEAGRTFSQSFAATLGQQTEKAVREAREEFASQMEYAKGELRLEGQVQRQQLHETLAQLGDQAMAEYKTRLENASNSWLLTTVTRLNQQSEQYLDTVARSTEERLRQTCNDVFTGIGETLRRRLMDLNSPASPATPPKTQTDR